MINKKIFMLTALAALSCVLFSACATSKNTESGAGFDAVKEKEWQLAQVLDSSGKVTYDHSNLPDEYFKDIYTLKFDDSRVSGKAAPNRYSGPYTLNGNKLSFKHFASTLMMGIKVPEGLSEYQYLQLLEKTTSWKYSKNNLKLSTVDTNGKKLTLVYKEFSEK
ncbi:heat shock protein HslJ [Parelusimicrobium proximum]|uniref:META domain-containing protein n=1 Tax=Parelusimicrobium proximum TaxID=3228953 RepID=UPI003D17066E